MSQARVKTSKFAARQGKTLTCQSCRREIEKGEVYRWWFKGFRSRFKHVRCMTCPAPRASELESSNRADAYAAVEAAEDALTAFREGDPEEDASGVESAVNEAGSGIREVVDQYREADESFGGGGMTQSGEIADELEEAADTLESWTAQDSEPDTEDKWCSDHEDEASAREAEEIAEDEDIDLDAARDRCDACQQEIAQARQEWWDALLEEADGALADAAI